MRRVFGIAVSVIVFIVFHSFPFESLGQSGKVSVIDAPSGDPLAYAVISFSCIEGACLGSRESFITDDNGEALNPFASVAGKTKVQVFFLGYHSRIDTLDGNNNLVYMMDPAVQQLTDFVITAQYRPGSINKSVYKIDVIDRQTIDAKGAINLGDLLTTQLNIQLSQDPLLGSNLQLQGISGENVKILVDGVPLIGRLNGNIDLTQVNLNNIERVEIVEGPLSVNYGTNALAGTINLISKHPRKKGVSAEAETYLESVGQYNFSGSIAYQKKNHRMNLQLARNFFDGYSVVDTSRHMEWNPREQYFGQFNYSRMWKQYVFNFRSDLFNETITNRGIPRKPYYETALDDYYKTNRFTNTLSARRYLKNEKTLEIFFNYSWYKRIKNTYFKNLVTLGETPTNNPGDQDTSYFDQFIARGTFAQAHEESVLNYQIGYDINLESAHGDRIVDGNQFIGDYALFGSLEYLPHQNLTIKPAVRVAYNTKYGAPFVPSIHLRYNVGKVMIRASAAKGFRAPSIKELYLFFVDINHDIHGNEDLMAEHSLNYNMSIQYHPLKEAASLALEGSFYFNDIENMITLAQVNASLYSYVNVGSYRTIGSQVRASWGIKNFQGYVGGGIIGRMNNPGEDGSEYLFTPELATYINYMVSPIQLGVAFNYKYTGESYTFTFDETGNVVESKIQDHHMADISLNRTFWGNRLTITAGVKNLFDVNNLLIESANEGSIHGSSTSEIPYAWGQSIFTKVTFAIP